MSFSQSLNVEDYLLFKEFQEFKKNKELKKSIDNTTIDNTIIDNTIIDNTTSRAIPNSSMTAFTSPAVYSTFSIESIANL